MAIETQFERFGQFDPYNNQLQTSRIHMKTREEIDTELKSLRGQAEELIQELGGTEQDSSFLFGKIEGIHWVQSGEPTFLDKLTDLQTKIGYVAGPIHPLAILGLMGETGEVSECVLIKGGSSLKINAYRQSFQQFAESLDGLKKKIRREEISAPTCEADRGFDLELADAFYYLKALAANRGLTIEDLARLSYEKVISRSGPVVAGDPAK